MKITPRFLSFFVFVLALQLHAQTYDLMVDNGVGSGRYEMGEKVHIFANTPKLKTVFIRWEGEGSQYLACPEEWYTTLEVPKGSGVTTLELRPVFDQLSPKVKVKFDSVLLWGERNEDPSTRFRMKKPAYVVFPGTKPKGCVFIFHGTGGSAHSFFQKYDMITLLQDLAYHNYAAFVLSSNETDLGDQNGNDDIQWLSRKNRYTTDNNIDLFNINEWKKMLISQYHLEDVPFFSFGVSNGANFGDLCSASLDFNATAHMVAHGSYQLFLNHPNMKPHIWLQARNDNHPQADPSIALANHKVLIKRGIPSEWHWLDKSPIYPTRFTRSINGIDEKLSRKIFNTIKSIGWLDKEGFLTYDAISRDSFKVLFSKIHLKGKQQKDVQEQFKVANAEHGAEGNFNKKIIAFFDRFLSPSTAVKTPKRSLNIHVFPSPCTRYLKVYGEANVETYQIFDAKGNAVTKDAYHESIDVTELPSGYYFIQIKTDEGTTTKRFIKS